LGYTPSESSRIKKSLWVKNQDSRRWTKSFFYEERWIHQKNVQLDEEDHQSNQVTWWR
jgi:hypothetical protein